MADTTLNGVLLKGVAASRPAANAVASGTIYSATDTGAITQSDGVSTWSTYATISSGMADPMTTRGDIIIRNAANTTARLARGAAGTVLTSDGTDVAYAAISLSSFTEVMGADLTQTNANQYYDAVSHSCAAGTWLFQAKAHWLTSGSVSHVYTARIWDGTTTYDEGEAIITTNNDGWVIPSGPLFAVVVLGSTTTIKLSTADLRAGQVALRNIDTNSASSHTATKLVGIKIA